MKKAIIHSLIIVAVGFLAYSNSFEVPFVLDDQTAITDQPVIRSLENFFDASGKYDYNTRRIVAYLTFAFNYRFGELDVTGYHIVNVVIHLACALLVYALVRLTFRTPYFQGQVQGSRFNNSTLHTQHFVPLFAALLFVAHPVQTQAVTYIVQRMTSLATFFYLLSLVLYVAARLRFESRVASFVEPRGSKNIGPSTLDPGSWTRLAPVLLLAGATVSAVLAMFTKEFAVTLPFAVLLYEISFFRGMWKNRLFYLLPLLLTVSILPVIVLMDNAPAGEMLAEAGGQMRLETDLPRAHYLFTQFRVIVTYLRLLVLPVNQNLDYDYPVYTTFFTVPVFFSFLLLAALFTLSLYAYWRSRPASPKSPDPELRLVGFGVLWFFLALSVESSLIPIADVIFEHRVYLPAMGAAAAFATTFSLVTRRFEYLIGGKILFLLAALIVFALSAVTFARNHVWRDGVALWADVVSKSPGKVRPYNNLGSALNDAGRPGEAIPILTQALSIDPDHGDAWYNLGRSYLLTGQNGDAIRVLREAIRLNPDHAEAYVNLAAALNRSRRFHEAVTLLEQNFNRLRDRADARFNLGVAYTYLGNMEAARRELSAVSTMDPRLAQQLANLLR